MSPITKSRLVTCDRCAQTIPRDEEEIATWAASDDDVTVRGFVYPIRATVILCADCREEVSVADLRKMLDGRLDAAFQRVTGRTPARMAAASARRDELTRTRRAELVARFAPLRLEQAAWFLRYGDGLTLDELGTMFDLSRERIGQLTKRLEYRAWWAAQLPGAGGGEPGFLRRLRAAGCFSGVRRYASQERIATVHTLTCGTDDLLYVEDIAAGLLISAREVREMAAAGKIPGRIPNSRGRRIWFDGAAARAWIAVQSRPA